MIRAEDIFVVFNSGTPTEKVALRGINFSAQTGEIVALIGNDGSGRSTLLRLLAGHIISSFGRIWLNGKDITHQTLAERSQYVSTVFADESIGTASSLTLVENLALASMHHQDKSIFTTAVDDEMREVFYQQLKELDFMGMENLLDESVQNLSKAQRHVLALMIAIIKGAELLIIDEHLSGLDHDGSEALQVVTDKVIRAKKITTIMATSNPKFILNTSDRAIIMNHGQIVREIDLKSENKPTITDIFGILVEN